MKYARKPLPFHVYKLTLQVRMGKGKGSFDYWASRIAVSKIIFELKGNVHEQVARDAFRLAGNKMPGMFQSSRHLCSNYETAVANY